jgi:hypothetical protein
MIKPHGGMFSLVRYGLIVLAATGITTAFLINKYSLPLLAVNTKDTPVEIEPDTAGWFQQAMKDISLQEYYITRNVKDSAYQCPNRAQNFRATIKPDRFSLQSRSQHKLPGTSWMLNLQLNQIQFDENDIFFPAKNTQAVLQENKIRFEHNKEFAIEYINDENGLRQNFIIHKIPGDSAHTVKVRLQASGTVTVRKSNDHEVRFSSKTENPGETILVYNDLKVWDATGRLLNAWMNVPSESIVEIEVDAANAQFPVTIDPLSASSFDWVAYGNNSGDKLGTAVAGAGDVNNDGYSDIVIATTRYDGIYTDEGAVYIYHGSANGLSASPAIILKGGDAATQGASNFGASVSTAGDINGDGCSDIIIGAPEYDNGGVNRGAAFIFYGSTTTGVTASGSCLLRGINPNDNFGISVSGAGDVNGDGYSDVAIGAPGYDVATTNDERGAAFIYFGNGAGILSGSAPSQMLQGPDVANEAGTWYFNNPDLFGAVVAGAGDVNGDGYSDVLVAASQYEEGVGDNASDDRDEGAVYVYHGGSTGLNTTAVIVLEGNRDQVKFGASIGTAGDVNGDGYSEIVVSSPDFSIYPGNGGTVPQYGGAVFIFSGSAAGITGTVLNASVTGLTLYGNVPFQRFGTSVRCAGDVNGDGFADVIVGATTYDNNRAATGTASGGVTGNTFIFYGRSGILGGFVASVNPVLKNIQSTQPAAEFGIAVASAGDINGDGFSDVIVGASDYDNGASINSGCVYAFNGGASGLSYTPVVMKERNQVNSNLGISVASAGDINGDGLGDVIIGANLWDNGAAINCGAIFIYHGLNNGGINNFSTPASPLIGPAGSNFGIAVSNAGDVNGDGYADIVAGANLAGVAGTAYIYHGSATGVSLTPSATVTGSNAGDNFGISVSGAGDVDWDGYSDIIVGANLYESSAAETNEGAAFVYYGSATGINTTEPHRLEMNQANSNFGIAVAHAGDVNQDGWSDVIVGADLYDNGQADEGAAFVFHGGSYGINTTMATRVESNQAGAQLGNAIAYAGDVNGDSYSDVIAGSYLYDNTQTDAGAAFVYHGGIFGLNNAPAVVLQGLNANDHFGVAVSSAGDINGDGYDDVLAGANLYDNGQADEGGVFAFHGGSTGVTGVPDVILESNQANANFGIAVAGAGDLNGDGFADAIAGANNYNGGQVGEGRLFIHLGNSKTLGALITNRPKSHNTGSSSSITSSNLPDLNFGIEALAKSYLGVQSGKMLWETRGSNQPWSVSPSGHVTNSIGFTSAHSDYSDLTQNGPPVLFTENVTKVISPYYGLSRARMRIKYDLVTSLTGQVYGPWRYIDRYGAALIAAQPVQPIVLAEKVKSFYAVVERCSATLYWQISTDIPLKHFIVETSESGQSFSEAAVVRALTNTVGVQHYSLPLTLEKNKSFYRLKMENINGATEYSQWLSVQSECNDTSPDIVAFPSPVKKGNNITLEIKGNSKYGKEVAVFLTDMAGRQFAAGSFAIDYNIVNKKTINTGKLEKGIYVLEIIGNTAYAGRSLLIAIN